MLLSIPVEHQHKSTRNIRQHRYGVWCSRSWSCSSILNVVIPCLQFLVANHEIGLSIILNHRKMSVTKAGIVVYRVTHNFTFDLQWPLMYLRQSRDESYIPSFLDRNLRWAGLHPSSHCQSRAPVRAYKSGRREVERRRTLRQPGPHPINLARRIPWHQKPFYHFFSSFVNHKIHTSFREHAVGILKRSWWYRTDFFRCFSSLHHGWCWVLHLVFIKQLHRCLVLIGWRWIAT